MEVSGDTAEVTVNAPERVQEDAATGVLIEQGLDPADWVVSGFRVSEWTRPNGDPGVSTRYTFKRSTVPALNPGRPDVDELVALFNDKPPVAVGRAIGSHGVVVLIGDTQFGKVDGDGAAGTISRTIACIREAARQISLMNVLVDIGHVHVVFLGDHVEGFVSQGGANTWRTQLTLTEQVRLTRRMMQYAVESFAPLAERVTLAAVPGNHDQAVRVAGKGVTRYDDSHDCEALVAISDAVQMANRPDLDHVEFYVPETDELTVTVPVAGTVVTAVHGHMYRPGQHFKWWTGQAFNQASALHMTDLLVAGHLHHLVVDSDGPRTFIQAPALEAESTWFRHATGTGGSPGIVLALTKDGITSQITTISKGAQIQ
ncbi:metallophosphoesterase [Catenuloplanes sp. NPDC051500]|uniref:metallophosphoesterase n=1 Tax=Catenuloplanes sp. NPDC051500 TaxID=3363959 RepID=UPI0037BDA965